MRTEQTPENFDEVAKELLEISRRMNDIASEMRRADLGIVLCHFSTIETHLVPRLSELSHKIHGEVRAQISTHSKGIKSQAEKEQEQYAKIKRKKKS